jgi:5-methylcytosine-specific restriction endonuclease McrA
MVVPFWTPITPLTGSLLHADPQVHHLIPLAQGGEDVLENTVVLCPTHHRYLHIGKGRGDLTKALQARRKTLARIIHQAGGFGLASVV